MKIKIAKLSPRLQTILVWSLRIVVGSLFIFSGLVKAIDPWGGIYKITEYFAVMHIDVTRESALVLACLLACSEFVAGVLLLLGAFRRTVVWFLSSFMLVMTPLTLWIYIANPVSDCGCFGDALILSNGATFAKNVVLCIMIALLLIYNKCVSGAYHFHLQWLVLVVSAFYAVAISIVGYFVQPIVDFRPYRVDTDLTKLINEQDDPIFIYQKGDKKQSFTTDSLPDDSWTFVERIQSKQSSSEIAIFDGDEDVTSQVLDLSEQGGLMLLCVTHPDRYGISRSRMANRLYDFMRQIDGTMVAVIAAQSDDEVDAWIDEVEARYDVYTADDTDLKSLVRGDAAVVYIKDNVIKWKYNVYALSPEIESIDDAKTKETITDLKPIEHQNLLSKFTVIYLSILCVIWLTASLPIMLYRYRKTKKQVKSLIDK
jgi:uncharacterized membrane protein YphA (DoxX/SURF4 family)